MRLSHPLSRLLTLTATLASMGISVSSSAHAVLTSPISRDGADANKTGPCGAAPIINGPNLYTAGQAMTVTWKETVNHPGCFVVAWSNDNNVTFNTLATVKHTTVGATPRPYSANVTLPAGNCTKCTLRVIQHMLADDVVPCPPAAPAAGSIYYSCAEMTTDPTRFYDMSMPASGDMAGSMDLSVAPDLATPPTMDGGTTATGCNFPGQAATSAGGLMVLFAAVSLLRRRR